MAEKIIRLSELVKPTPRQREFLEAADKFKYVLYGGAAGGGKSYILRWWCLLVALKAFLIHKVPSVKVGLFCENYPALQDRQISKISQEFPATLGEIKKTQTEGLVFKLKPEFGGGMILPRNLDDPSKYNSVEFAAIAVDELTRNPQEVFDELRKRLRWPGFPESYRFPFVGGTNPGGIGHSWVKRLWIDRDFPAELKDVSGSFAFVQAKASDNPHNPASYYADLLTLPENLRRAYAEGDWDLFAGQFFSEWRKELHVCKAFPIPGYWKKWRAGDWGWNAHTSIGWYTKSPDNLIYKYRELYVRQLTPAQVARRIHELEAGEKIDYGMLDPACWNSHDGGLSVAEQFQNEGISWLKAENDRSGGWTRVRELLRWERNPAGGLVRAPQFQVFENCTNTIRTFPSQVFDENKPEDLDTDGEDHAVDETRYGLNSRHGSTIVPIEQLPNDLAEAMLRLQHQSG